ncbi:MAG: peptide deformylase [Gammaproteobacteria bacterium]
MSTLKVVLHPHPSLRVIAEPITAVDADIRQLVNDMWETMYFDRGVGLAATQVDVRQRLFVADVSENGNEPRCFINPEIIEKSETDTLANEGCLSFPEMYLPITRPEIIKVKFLDEHGEERILEADGLLARCIQHETDHLNGVVFIDHVTRMKRERALKKYFKELNLHKVVF